MQTSTTPADSQRRAHIRTSARALFTSALQTEGLRLKDPAEVTRMAKLAASAANEIEDALDLTGPKGGPTHTPAGTSREQEAAPAAGNSECVPAGPGGAEVELGSMAPGGESGSYSVGLTGFCSAGPDGRVGMTVIKGRNGIQVFSVGGTYGKGGPWDSHEAAALVVDELNARDAERAAAVRRADAVATERDDAVADASGTRKRFETLEARLRTAVAERDEAQDSLRSSELKRRALESALEEWDAAADAVGLPEGSAPSDRLFVLPGATEVESIDYQVGEGDRVAVDLSIEGTVISAGPNMVQVAEDQGGVVVRRRQDCRFIGPAVADTRGVAPSDPTDAGSAAEGGCDRG